jgi:hypothetical protein
MQKRQVHRESALSGHFRSSPGNGHPHTRSACLKRAKTGLMQCSKQRCRSIISSARSRNPSTIFTATLRPNRKVGRQGSKLKFNVRALRRGCGCASRGSTRQETANHAASAASVALDPKKNGSSSAHKPRFYWGVVSPLPPRSRNMRM